MMAFLDILQFPVRGRQRRVRAERKQVTREQFVAALAQDDLEARAAALLWDKMVEAAVVEDFRPSPDDDFLSLYGLAEEDLDEDIILAIITALGVDVPTPAMVEGCGPINTPRDLIRLVSLAKENPSGRQQEP